MACGLYILRTAVYGFASITSAHNSANFSISLMAVAHPAGAAVAEGCAFFLAHRSAGSKAIRRTLFFSILWFLVQSVVGIYLYLTYEGAGVQSNFVPQNKSPYWIIINSERLLWYTIYLIYLYASGNPRRGAFLLGWFELCIYVITVVGDVLILTDRAVYAECMLFATWSLWTVLFPPIFYYVLRVDSEYWMSLGHTPKDSHEMPSPAIFITNANNTLDDIKEDGVTKDFQKRFSHSDLDVLVDFDRLSFFEKIGVGGSATVFRGRLAGREVAIKQFKCEVLTPETIGQFSKEIRLSAHFRHRNLVQSVAVCVVPPSICLVQEFVPRGSLFRVLSHYPNLDISTRLHIASGVCCGLAYLHSQKPQILHRDLKSLNVLIDARFNAKLADFGEAREVLIEDDAGDEGSSFAMTTERGTPQWMAPEMFVAQNYNAKVDIYSLGIVLWEIGTGQRPFANISPWLVPSIVLERKERPVFTPSSVEQLPEAYIRLTEACWSHDPMDRPSAAEAYKLLEVMKLSYTSDKKVIARKRAAAKKASAPPPQSKESSGSRRSF